MANACTCAPRDLSPLDQLETQIFENRHKAIEAGIARLNVLDAFLDLRDFIKIRAFGVERDTVIGR